MGLLSANLVELVRVSKRDPSSHKRHRQRSSVLPLLPFRNKEFGIIRTGSRPWARILEKRKGCLFVQMSSEFGVVVSGVMVQTGKNRS